MDAIKARENLEINGINDDVDVDPPVEPRPTCCKLYQAASVIARYMDDMICILSCNDFCKILVPIFSTILKLHTPSNAIARGVHRRV